MDFFDVIEKHKPKNEDEPEKPESEINDTSFDSDIPKGMPLTNRLDKMTKEQAIWAIRNGDAWIAYLKTKEGIRY